MAVVVQCFHCSNILELDEGFRGGVCRCSQCGALLQVPKASPDEESMGSSKGRPAAPEGPSQQHPPHRPESPLADPGLSRGAFSRPAAPNTATATADQDLPSSGTFSRSGRPAVPPPPAAPGSGADTGRGSAPGSHAGLGGPHIGGAHTTRMGEIRSRNFKLWIIMGLLLFAVIIAAVILMPTLLGSLTGEKPVPLGSVTIGAKNTPADARPADGGKKPVYAGPTFLSVPLTGKKIALSIDAGSSFEGRGIEYVLLAVKQATEVLADDQSLQLVLWRDGGAILIPTKGFVGREQRREIVDALDNISPQGATSEAACIKTSLGTGCDQLIIVTAKLALGTSVNLATLLRDRQMNQRIDVVRVLSPGAETLSAFEKLTNQANGSYVSLELDKLDALTKGK